MQIYKNTEQVQISLVQISSILLNYKRHTVAYFE